MRISIKLAEIRALTHGFLLGFPPLRGAVMREVLVTAWWLELWRLCLRLCTRVCCTVLRDQGVGCDHRSPDDPSRPGIKDVLVSRLDLELKRLVLLASVLGTVSRVGKVQDVGAGGDLYLSDPQTRVEGLIIERHEAYRVWQYDACVRLRTVWLLRGGEATQQPACPSKEQHEPTEFSSHGSFPMLLLGSSGIVCRAYGVFSGAATSF